MLLSNAIAVMAVAADQGPCGTHNLVVVGSSPTRPTTKSPVKAVDLDAMPGKSAGNVDGVIVRFREGNLLLGAEGSDG